MKGFLSIKEFSELSGIEVSTLRYWEDEGLFTPAKRDETNGYRYYLPEQVFQTRFVSLMTKLKVPRKTIIKIQKESTSEEIDRILERQEILLNAEIRKMHDMQTAIFAKRKRIRQGKEVKTKLDESAITIITREDVNCIMGPRNEYGSKGEGYLGAFMKFYSQADKLGINVNYQFGGLHDSWAGFLDAPGEPPYFFSSDPKGKDKIPGGRFLMGYTRGPYGVLNDLPERLDKYAKENKLKLTGSVDMIYLHDSVVEKDETKYLAQVCARLQ